MDDSVKKWWPKVVAAVTRTDQTTLDLGGEWCILCVCVCVFSVLFCHCELYLLFKSLKITSQFVQSGCAIDSNRFKWLTVAFPSLKHLKQLNMNGNCAKQELYICLLCVICHVMCRHTLMCLCVCVSTGNKIGDDGAKALSQCLPHLTQLSQLHLNGKWCILCCVVCVLCHVMCRHTLM